MLGNRIIPCLDIKDGRTVKGTNFTNLRDAGDPVELAKRYAQEGADELVFLDITASEDKRQTVVDLVQKVAKSVDIPFTVGGGIRNIGDIRAVIDAGADKVSLNSIAITNPELVREAADVFGSQSIVVAIDALQEGKQWWVHTHGGKRRTNHQLLDWALRMEEYGAGEILFTSMNHDGAKQGFALHMLGTLNERLSIPLIASGGAGCIDDFQHLFEQKKASAGLAASIFHYQEVSIPQLKLTLEGYGIPIRPYRS